jgi:hypothetical protein
MFIYMPRRKIKKPHSSTRRLNKRRIKTGKRRQTLKNDRPFDAVSEINRRSAHKKYMKKQQISSNPFATTAANKYGYDPNEISIEKILKIANEIDKKRRRRRIQGKSELTKTEKENYKKGNDGYRELMERIRPPYWNKEAWTSEVDYTLKPGRQITPPTDMINRTVFDNLEPIGEISIIEREIEEEPVIDLNMGSLFSRRKLRREKSKKGGRKKTRRKKTRRKRRKKQKKTINRPIAGNCFTKWLEQRNRPQNTIKFTEECERMNNELDREQDRLSINRKTKKASYKVKWNPGSNETPRERLERIIHEITGRGHNVTSKHMKRKHRKRKQNKGKQNKRKK